jgi:hypothetical protein
MKRFLPIIIFIIYHQPALSQEHGVKSISLTIDSTATELYRESHALLIGVSVYKYSWPDLPGVKRDIDNLKPVLEKLGFDVTVVENPTKAELDQAIMNFIIKYGQEIQNRLLIYFSGHGRTLTTNYGEELGYFVPADAPSPIADPAGFKSIALPMSQVEIYAKQIESKHAIFLFDACFSGSLFSMTRAIPDAISYKTVNPVRQFITSGSANEEVPDESIFRKEFIRAITSSYADANKDGYLTGSELGEYLQTNVTNYSYNRQHPQYGKIRDANLDKGDFIFVLPQDVRSDMVQSVAVPKLLKTNRLNNYPFHGLYLRAGSGVSAMGSNQKISFFYSSSFLNDRYCVGLEGNLLITDYIQIFETFPGIIQQSETAFSYYSLDLYNRLYLFPQNQAVINFYAGTSISWNDWQIEIGLRPFLTKKMMLELHCNYLMHYGQVQNFRFSPYGNSEEVAKMNLFKNYYFGLNFLYFISFL